MPKHKETGIVEFFEFIWDVLEFSVQLLVAIFGIVWIIKKRKGGKK